MNPNSRRDRRFTVDQTPRFGHDLQRTPGLSVGDIVTVSRNSVPDMDGDYLVRKESTGRTAFVRAYQLREIHDGPVRPTPEKVAVKAVERAAKALGLEEAAIKSLVAISKAIEAGI